METGRGTEQRQRVALADVIERRQDDIIARWAERVRADVVRRHVDPTELHDAIGDYLRNLADGLRAADGLPTAGSGAWEKLAREHAVARVRLGFDVDQLVREFIILRGVLVETAREEGALVDERQHDRLADLIEAAILSAVRSYVEARDYQSRRAEAEHVGFLTHELRNPLGIAILGASRLRRMVAGEAAKLLQTIESALGRLNDLIDGVLLVGRLEAGEVSARPTEVELQEVVDEAVRGAREAAKAKRIALKVAPPPGVLLYVERSLAVSAIANVVDNGVKFTDEGEVEVAFDDGPTELTVHVRDNCGGLSSEELRTLFLPFKRGHSSKPGSGLGLAIDARAMEANGGAIVADSSTSERGCHFALRFPKARH